MVVEGIGVAWCGVFAFINGHGRAWASMGIMGRGGHMGVHDGVDMGVHTGVDMGVHA